MKKILWIILLVFLCLKGYSQNNTGTAEKKEADDTEDVDDVDAPATIKIMVIPHNPSYNKIDVAKEAKERGYSDKKEEEVTAWFSFGLDQNITPRILTINHEKKQLLNDYSTDSENDLSSIYSSLDYKYEKRDKKYVKKNQMLVDGLMSKLKQKEDLGVDGVNRDYESDKKHKEYLNVVVEDPTLLPRLGEKYGVQLFVFINQFEIFTDYKKLIDEENKIYERQIKIHFSIFDNNGDQLYGDLAVLTFVPSVNKNIDDIIMERFPIVANYMSSNNMKEAGE